MMKRPSAVIFLVLVGLFVWPVNCPAPIVYRPGEGLTYEPVGGSKWQRARAKDQLDVAQAAFDSKQYRLATKAARRVVKKWPTADHAPQAQYLVGRCYEARRMDEKAFKEYQKTIEKYPKAPNYAEVLRRQFEIADRYLKGQWFKLWGYIPFFPSMEKTSEMFTTVVRNGPFSDVGPQAQLKLGAAREKQKDFPEAVRAYEKAADVYSEMPAVAAEAAFKAGFAYYRQAQKAEYDQGASSQAIATFNDFAVLFPTDPRVAEAQRLTSALRAEQARGSYKVAKFYENKRQYISARVYYNEVINQDPNSEYAAEAKRRIEAINKQVATP